MRVVDPSSSRYKQLGRVDVDSILFPSDSDGDAEEAHCHYSVRMLWETQVGSAVLSAPLIVDLSADGVPDVVVCGVRGYVEALRGVNGRQVTESGEHGSARWPFAFSPLAKPPVTLTRDRSTTAVSDVPVRLLASPLAHDVDADGDPEILVSTLEAQMVFLHSDGSLAWGLTLQVPKLQVDRFWYKTAQDGSAYPSVSLLRDERHRSVNNLANHRTVQAPQKRNNRIFDMPSPLSDLFRAKAKAWNKRKLLALEGVERSSTVPASARSSGTVQKQKASLPDQFDGFGGWLSAEGVASLDLLLPANAGKSLADQVLRRGNPFFSRQYQLHSSFFLENMGDRKLSEYVMLDPHLLATPVIADLDGDGVDELVAVVSYYFDPQVYQDVGRRAALGEDVHPVMFAACAVVAFELANSADTQVGGRLLWQAPLEMSRFDGSHTALASSSPTLVDLDRDGHLEILVGTGLGYVHALRSDGTPYEVEGKSGLFPLLADTILVSPVAADLTGDGNSEIVVADSNSNLVCFSSQTGLEVWHTRLSGHPVAEPTLVDLNGDGHLDVVVGTSAGHLWAVDGLSGQTLDNFPVRLHGRTNGPVLAVHLASSQQFDDLSGAFRVPELVLHADDGHLYVIQPSTGCMEVIDVGGSSEAGVLATDLDQDGLLELVLALSDARVVAMSTPASAAPHHVVQREQVAVRVISPQGGDVVPGNSFPLHILIHDSRPAVRNQHITPYYLIRVRWGRLEILLEETFYAAGEYVVDVPAPEDRSSALVSVELETEDRHFSVHQVTLKFHWYYYRILKWIVFGSFTVLAAVAFASSEVQAVFRG